VNTHYVIPVAMLPPSAADGPKLLIDGKDVVFMRPEARLTWSWETRPTSAWALVTIPWTADPNNAALEEAFDATPGVVRLPPIWDATAPMAPAALDFFATELPAAVRIAPGLTFADARKALPRQRQRMLLPW
jgi:hypothetical protein